MLQTQDNMDTNNGRGKARLAPTGDKKDKKVELFRQYSYLCGEMSAQKKKSHIGHCLVLSIILLFTGGLSPVHAQDGNSETQHRIDSLRPLLPSLEGQERMNVYRKLDSLYNLIGRFDEHIACLNEEIKYARKQDNLEAEGRARLDILETCYNCGSQSWTQYLEKIDDDMAFWRDNEQWKRYYFAFYAAMKNYILDNQAQTALDKASKEYNSAKSRNYSPGKGVASAAMGLAYQSLGRYDEAVKCFNESVDMLKKEKFLEHGSLLMEIYEILSPTLYNNGDTIGSLRVLDDWGQLLKANEQYTIQLHWLEWYAMFGIIYADMGRLSEAEEMLEKADKIATGMGGDLVAMVKGAYVSLYIAQKKYDKALSLADSVMNNFQLRTDGYILMQQYKLTIADSTGNTALAAETYKDLYLLNDSIKTKEMAAQLDELRTIYEVDKITAEKQIMRNYLLFALAGCLLLSIALWIWIYLHRQIARKNRSLYIQIQELLQKEKEVEQQLLAAPEEELSRAGLLFRSLSELMQKEKLFTDPVLNRKKLADQLGTNEMYLADAIREATGETFSTYLANLRLQYTLKLLNEQPNMTFDAIAIDSGHGSYSAFFRSFSKKYGITPSEYRKMAMTKKNEYCGAGIK